MVSIPEGFLCHYENVVLFKIKFILLKYFITIIIFQILFLDSKRYFHVKYKRSHKISQMPYEPLVLLRRLAPEDVKKLIRQNPLPINPSQ